MQTLSDSVFCKQTFQSVLDLEFHVGWRLQLACSIVGPSETNYPTVIIVPRKDKVKIEYCSVTDCDRTNLARLFEHRGRGFKSYQGHMIFFLLFFLSLSHTERIINYYFILFEHLTGKLTYNHFRLR